MSGGKSSGGSRDYYGHAAGIVCQGQLDFVWGMLLNNELVWPKVKLWDSRIYPKNKVVIYTDGNVYRTPQKTDTDPPNSPWQLFAIPWTAGTYIAGARRLHSGHVWETVATTSSVPPTTPPGPALAIQSPVPVNGWIYVGTPQTWTAGSGSNFWAANSITAWKGRLYTTSAGTKVEPPGAPWSLWRVNRVGSPNPLKFTVEDYGDAYLYWGASDQVLDAVDEAILNSLGHPPYRHRAVLVLKNFLFGTMQTSPPDVQILGGRVPQQSLITGNAALMDTDWQVNPWCVLAEFLTHPVLGLGLPLSLFNQASWQTEADWCYARSSLTYISPMFTSLQKVRALVSDLLGYPDAFLFWSTIAQLTAGHWPHGEAAPVFTAGNTIDRNDMVSEIATNSDGWSGTADSVVLSFDDIQAAFKSRPVHASNLFNRSVTRRLQSLKVERPHIVRFNQAAAWAAESAKLAGEQASKGTLTVRAEKATAINPGSLFLLTDDELQTSEAQRCTRRVVSAPPTGTVKLTHETERGVSPQPYSPTEPAPTPEQGPSPTAIRNAIFLQVPAALGGGPSRMLCLATRDSAYTSSCDVWFQFADTDAYQQLATLTGFGVLAVANGGDELTSDEQNEYYRFYYNPAVPSVQMLYNSLPVQDMWNVTVTYQPNPGDPITTATEGTDYVFDESTGIITFPATTTIPNNSFIEVKWATEVRITRSANTPQVDYDLISSPRTQDEINDGTLLIFAMQEGHPEKFEIMSVKHIANYGNGISYVRVKRALYGTLMGGDATHAWGGNDVVVIISKSSLVPFFHETFPALQRTNSQVEFLLTPSSAWVQAEITDLFDAADNPEGLTTQWSYTFNNLYAPAVTVVSKQRNGADIPDLTATTFTINDEFHFVFQITDRNADLTHAALTAVLGSQEVTLWSRNFEPSTTQIANVKWKFPSLGRWRLFWNVLDASGNQADYPLQNDGTSIFINVASGTTVIGTPVIYSYGKAGDYITNLLFGWNAASATVKYQLQNRGVAYNPASWVVAPAFGSSAPEGQKYGPVPNFKSGAKTLYAFIQRSGTVDSAVMQWNL